MPGSVWLLPLLGLGAGFWLLPLSEVSGRDPSPAELIQQGLSGRQTLKSASKVDLLSALCRAVRQRRTEAPAITSAAVTARPALAPEIVSRLLSCSGKLDCDFVGMIVSAAIGANNNAATAIGDAAVARAPNCADLVARLIKEAGRRAAGELEPSGTAANGSPDDAADVTFDPFESLILVCDNGTPRAIRQSLVDEFLHTHPGSFRGACSGKPWPTPAPVKSPSATTSPGRIPPPNRGGD
jgi:hypothetical protein